MAALKLDAYVPGGGGVPGAGMVSAKAMLPVTVEPPLRAKTIGPSMAYEVPLPMSPGEEAPPVMRIISLFKPDARVRFVGVVPPEPVPTERHM